MDSIRQRIRRLAIFARELGRIAGYDAEAERLFRQLRNGGPSKPYEGEGTVTWEYYERAEDPKRATKRVPLPLAW